MKQLTQHYLVNIGDPSVAKLGQMVYRDDFVVGFISKLHLDSGKAEFTLFQPEEIEFHNGMVNLHSTYPNWKKVFTSVLENLDPETKSHWINACKTP